MNIITIEQARDHCKTDGADDDQLTLYANAAEAACARLANRALFVDQAALDAALATVPAGMAAAYTAYNNAITAAASLDADNRRFAEGNATQALLAAQGRYMGIVAGIVADDAIKAAILLTVGHFYRNREEVVVGQSGKPEQLPVGAERIMRWYRLVGPL